MKNSINRIISVIVLLLFMILIAMMGVHLMPLLKEVAQNANNESKMINYIDAYGIKGVPILLGLQALQVIIAFFPAAAIQILAGLCYGLWFGTLISITGYLLGNLFVFSMARQFSKFFAPFIKKKQHNKQHRLLADGFIKQMKNPEFMVLIFYLVPGIPNGVLPYIFAETNISLSKYLFHMTIASIPSIFITSFIGERIARGDYITAIVITSITLAIVVLLMVFKNKIMDAIEKYNSKS